MFLIHRHMLYRLVASVGAATAAVGVFVLLTSTSDLFFVLVQGAVSFSRFTLALGSLLPVVFAQATPVGVAAGVGFAYHQWNQHHEILPLRAAGFTTLSLALPGLIAALIAMVFTGAMSLYLLPVAFRTFEDIRFAAAFNLTVNAFDEGYLQTLVPDLSMSFRRRVSENEFEGMTVLDGRKKDSFIYIFADRGHLVVRSAPRREEVLVLEKGSYIKREKSDEHPNPVAFQTLSIPVATVKDVPLRQWRGFYEEHVNRLVDPPPDVRQSPGIAAEWIAEGHNRIISPILCVSYVILALGIILRGGYQRHSGRVLRNLALGVAILGWDSSIGMGHSLVVRVPELLPIMYVQALVPLALGAALLFTADRRRPPRAASAILWRVPIEAKVGSGVQ